MSGKGNKKGCKGKKIKSGDTKKTMEEKQEKYSQKEVSTLNVSNVSTSSLNESGHDYDSQTYSQYGLEIDDSPGSLDRAIQQHRRELPARIAKFNAAVSDHTPPSMVLTRQSQESKLEMSASAQTGDGEDEHVVMGDGEDEEVATGDGEDEEVVTGDMMGRIASMLDDKVGSALDALKKDICEEIRTLLKQDLVREVTRVKTELEEQFEDKFTRLDVRLSSLEELRLDDALAAAQTARTEYNAMVQVLNDKLIELSASQNAIVSGDPLALLAEDNLNQRFEDINKKLERPARFLYDRTVVVHGVEIGLGENPDDPEPPEWRQEKAREMLFDVLNLNPDEIEIVDTARLPKPRSARRTHIPGMKIEFRNEAQKIAVLKVKADLKNSQNMKHYYVRSSASHHDRMARLNFEFILQQLNLEGYTVTGNGVINDPDGNRPWWNSRDSSRRVPPEQPLMYDQGAYNNNIAAAYAPRGGRSRGRGYQRGVNR